MVLFPCVKLGACLSFLQCCMADCSPWDFAARRASMMCFCMMRHRLLGVPLQALVARIMTKAPYIRPPLYTACAHERLGCDPSGGLHRAWMASQVTNRQRAGLMSCFTIAATRALKPLCRHHTLAKPIGK
jgi:hypothetical protein